MYSSLKDNELYPNVIRVNCDRSILSFHSSSPTPECGVMTIHQHIISHLKRIQQRQIYSSFLHSSSTLKCCVETLTQHTISQSNGKQSRQVYSEQRKSVDTLNHSIRAVLECIVTSNNASQLRHVCSLFHSSSPTLNHNTRTILEGVATNHHRVQRRDICSLLQKKAYSSKPTMNERNCHLPHELTSKEGELFNTNSNAMILSNTTLEHSRKPFLPTTIESIFGRSIQLHTSHSITLKHSIGAVEERVVTKLQ